MECEENVDNSALPRGGDSTFKEQIFYCKPHTHKTDLVVTPELSSTFWVSHRHLSGSWGSLKTPTPAHRYRFVKRTQFHFFRAKYVRHYARMKLNILKVFVKINCLNAPLQLWYMLKAGTHKKMLGNSYWIPNSGFNQGHIGVSKFFMEKSYIAEPQTSGCSLNPTGSPHIL